MNNNLFAVIEVERIGKSLAHEGDERQAALINSLASELHIGCGGDSRKIEMQLCYISALLTPRGYEFVKELASFVELREIEAKATKETQS